MEDAPVWKHLRGLTPLSLCDWPGKPCCVVFLGGCNLRCPTCHNAELARNMTSLPLITRAELKGFLAKRGRWLSGITVTGGEPTNVPGLGEVLHELALSGLPVKLDSNGMRPDVLELVLAEGLAAVIHVDVKGPFARYPELTGGAASARDAERSLSKIFELARRQPERFAFRTTLVPGLENDDIEAVRALLPQGFELTIQDYKPPRRHDAQSDSETRRTAGNLVN